MAKKSKVSKDCIEKARVILNKFTRDELRSYYNEVMNSSVKNKISVTEAMKLVDKEISSDLFHECKSIADDTNVFERHEQAIKGGKASLRSIGVRRHEYEADNMEAHKHNAKHKLNDQVMSSLEGEELGHARDSRNQEAIADGFDGKEVSQIDKSVGQKIFGDFVGFRNAYALTTNTLLPSEIKQGRYLKQYHNRSKMIRGSQNMIAGLSRFLKKYDITRSKMEWVNKAKLHLDARESFPDGEHIREDGSIDDAEYTKLLENTFDNITTQKSVKWTQSKTVNDRDAVRRKKTQQLVFKSARDFVEYNKVYGTGDLFSALLADIESSGNKIGITEAMGTNPLGMYLDLKKVQEEVSSKSNSWYNLTDLSFKTGLGEYSAIVDADMATMFANKRSYTGMARLGSIVFTSMGDAHSAIVYAQRFLGEGYFNAYTNQLRNQFGYMASDEAKILAKQMKWNIDHTLGYLARFSEAQTIGKLTNRLTTGFYKGIQAEALDKGNKQGVMSTIGMGLGDQSHLKFEELNPRLQEKLDSFGIAPHEWDELRTRNTQINGHNLFTLDNVSTLTNAETRKLWDQSDKSYSLGEYKDALYRKVYSIFDVASENAVVAPGDWIKTFMYGGHNPGTWLGEIWRTLTQFKGYALSYIDRVLVGGWSDADGAMAKLGWASAMFAAMVPMTYAGMWLENYGHGKTTPDLRDFANMSYAERFKFTTQLLAGPLGVFLGIADPQNQNGGMATALLAGPTTRFVSEALAGPLSVATGGDPKTLLKHWKKASNYLNPTASLPGISPFVNQALGNKPYLQPGQKMQPWAPQSNQ